MTLAQIDRQIAKWKQLQSNVSIKLVDLDEMPTYLGIRSGLYVGTTALAAGEIRNHIDAMWALSAQWSDAFAKAIELRAHSPLPWEKERWLRDLEARLLGPVVVHPSTNPLDPTDALSRPTLTLGRALTEIVNEYDRVIDLVHRIDARLGEAETKIGDLERLAEGVGAGRPKSALSEIGDQIRSDPLGVSLDSFASIEAQLRRVGDEVGERSAIMAALDRGEKRIREAPRLWAEADARAEDCKRHLGQALAIPRLDLDELLEWAQTLRTKLSEAELSSIKVGVARWESALDGRMRPLTEADRSNRDRLERYREVVGRFSAAKAQAAGAHHPSRSAEQMADRIQTGLGRLPKNLEALENDLVAYERLIRG